MLYWQVFLLFSIILFSPFISMAVGYITEIQDYSLNFLSHPSASIPCIYLLWHTVRIALGYFADGIWLKQADTGFSLAQGHLNQHTFIDTSAVSWTQKCHLRCLYLFLYRAGAGFADRLYIILSLTSQWGSEKQSPSEVQISSLLQTEMARIV